MITAAVRRAIWLRVSGISPGGGGWACSFSAATARNASASMARVTQQDLTPADIRLGPVDLEMLDTVITTGTAASRAEAIGWVLARIRERPAYARLEEGARELDELKAHF